MKKSLLILIAVIGFGIIVNAQDVILKQDGSKIKAKVLEITEQQVKYKDFDFQDGPTRNINISEIFMIMYENGQEEVFSNQKSISTPQGSELQAEFYKIGTNDSEMLKFFKRNNFVRYSTDFEAACRMREAGKGLLGAGLISTVAGGIFMVIGFLENNYGMAISGCALAGTGEILIIVSIPVSAVAGAKKKAIKNEFAREKFSIYSNLSQPTLNFGCIGNGLGISLKF